MTIGLIFTKIGSFIQNRQTFTFMLLNCNCVKLANFEDFQTCLGGRFLWTQCRTRHDTEGIGVTITNRPTLSASEHTS